MQLLEHQYPGSLKSERKSVRKKKSRQKIGKGYGQTILKNYNNNKKMKYKWLTEL